ncbi:MAG: leucine-rich repeat protein, partial [Lachnospiraceae bacterium]|nr:leucine-rich repeat protein [Lachnospiraceae bacterium]
VPYVTIKYDLNYDGCPKNTIPDSKMYDGKELEIPNVWPERAGYVFLGWATDPTDLTGSYSGEKVGLLFEDQTLYATWTEVSSFGVRDSLRSLLGSDKFPDELFINAQPAKWISIPESKAYVCLKTKEVDYGDEGIRKNYLTDAFVFGINSKEKLYVKDFAGFELQFNPVDMILDVFKTMIVTNNNNGVGEGLLAAIAIIKLIKNIAINRLTGVDLDFVTKDGKLLWSIFTTGVSVLNDFANSDFSTEQGRAEFILEYQTDDEHGLFIDTLKVLLSVYDDEVGDGVTQISRDLIGKKLAGKLGDLMASSGGDFVEFFIDILDIISMDKKYKGFDPYGDMDNAVGTVIERMSEVGFSDTMCNEVHNVVSSLYNNYGGKTVKVKCPVDVKVYNADGDLLGYIKDDVPQVIEDSGMITYVDENGHKCIEMIKDRQYTMEIIATDDGEVSVIVETNDLSSGEPSEIKTYSAMNVKKGDVINVDVMSTVEYETSTEDGCKAETPVKLVINDGEEVEPTVVQKGTQIVTYNVTAGSSNAEAGTVTGGGSFYNGEFCKVTATAKDEYEFKGWMEDGKLVSSDAEYRFEINADHSITAEFTKKNITEGGNSGSGNSGSGNSGSGNSGGSSGGYSGGGSSGGYSGGGSSGGYSGGGSSGGVSGGGSAGGTSGGVSGGSIGGTTGGTSGGSTGGTTGGTTGTGGSSKTDGKDGDTSKEFEVKVGAVYTDENGVRYSITAIKGTKKATANTVKYIGPEKSSVKKIVIPNTVTIEGTTYTVTELDTSWTKGNKKLTTVVINDNIKKIPTDAFNGCKALKSITFGAKVTTIGTRAFYNCAKLKTVKLPAKLTKIGSKAFYGCSALEGITIPSMVESISSYAFYRCRKLYKVTIKSKHLTDKKIGKKAFAGIVTNAVIKVPKSVLDKYTEMLKKAGVTKNMTVTK